MINIKVIIGLIGVVILVVAQFSSTVRVPVMGGSEGYVYNGIESILFILLLSIVSLFLIIKKKFKSLRIMGIITLVTPLLFYIYAATVLNNIRSYIERNIIKDTNMPVELAEIMINKPVEIMFGEVLLVIGAVAILIASIIPSGKNSS